MAPPIKNSASLPVVLLAAGRGKRLAPLTNNRPKALLEVGGQTLAARALRMLKAAGVDHFVVVGGHEAERLTELDCELRTNPRYDTADNIYSLYLARDVVAGGCLIVNSDVLFGAGIAKQLVASSGTTVLCDDSAPPAAEAMKVIVRDGRLANLAKQAAPEDALGEYIGLSRIDPEHGGELAKVLEEYVMREDVHVYYEDALTTLARRLPVKVESVGGAAWIEIDDHDDLARAQREIVGLIG